MTDEEREKLCARLLDTSIPLEEIDDDIIVAAKEIMRLADRVKSLEAALNKSEAERLARENAELRTQLDNLDHEVKYGDGR